MLQEINSRIQGWFAGVIVSLIALTFVLWGIESYLGGNSTNTFKAKVDNIKISDTAFQQAYKRLTNEQEAQLGANFALTASLAERLKQQALQQLITSTALQQAAFHSGYFISDKQAEDAITQIPAFQENGVFSQQKFLEILNGALYTPEGFMQQIQSDMLINQLHAGITASAFALPTDIVDAIQLIDQHRSIRYVLLPSKTFAKGIQPGDKELQNYYHAHQDQFTTPEKVSLSYLQLSLKQLMAKLHFTDQQLQTYYNENSDNYKKPPRWQIAHILLKVPANATPEQVAQIQKQADAVYQQAVKGANFSTLAKEHSADALSAQKGGELPWISPGTLEPSFQQAITLLTKPGAISTPVKTKYGFEIIKLLAIQKAEQIPFAQVKDTIVQTMAAQKAQTQFSDMNDQLANLTYSNPDNLNIAAKALNLPIQTTELFSKEGGKEGLASNKKIITAAFNPDVLTNGDNSDVIQISNDSVVVIRIDKHEKAAEKPFAQVENQIRDLLTTQQSQQKAEQYAQSLIKDMHNKSEQQLSEMIHASNLSWVTADDISRIDKKIDPNIIKLAFKLPHPGNADKHPAALVKLANNDYAVVVLQNITAGQAKHLSKEQQALKDQLENSIGQYNYALYVQGVMAKAKVQTFN